MNTKPILLCKDCKHVRQPFSPEEPYTYARCAAAPRGISLVDGTNEGDTHCSVARTAIGACGPDGKLWEAKR